MYFLFLASHYSSRRGSLNPWEIVLWVVYVWSDLEENPVILRGSYMARTDASECCDECGRVYRVSQTMECYTVCVLCTDRRTWIYCRVSNQLVSHKCNPYKDLFWVYIEITLSVRQSVSLINKLILMNLYTDAKFL